MLDSIWIANEKQKDCPQKDHITDEDCWGKGEIEIQESCLEKEHRKCLEIIT